MYRNVPKNLFQNVAKCAKKAISKNIWVGKGTLDVILSQINKKIGDRFHFQGHWRRLNYQFSNSVTDKVNGSRVQPSLFREDQRQDPGDSGNEHRWHLIYFTVAWHVIGSLQKEETWLIFSGKEVGLARSLLDKQHEFTGTSPLYG